MNPANYREALIETREDESEGADILLVSILFKLFNCIMANPVVLLTCQTELQVKPGLPYLDIIRLLRDNSSLPIAAYQVI